MAQLFQKGACPIKKLLVRSQYERLVFCGSIKKSYRVFQPHLFPARQDIFENVSEKAWKEWQGNQTMLMSTVA